LHTRLAVVLTALALAAVAPVHAAEGGSRKKVKIAVMEIRALGADTHMTDLLSEVALTEVGAMDRVEVIGRSDIDSMLGFEKQKQMLGCSEEASCVAEIGGALGVEYVIVGSLGRIGALYRLDMKLVETSRGRVRARTGESVDGREEKLVASVQRAVHRLVDPIVMTGPAGQPPPPTLAAPTPAPVPEPVSEPAPKKGSSRKTWGWTVGGVGAAALVGGVVSGLSAKSAYDAEKAAAAAGDIPTFESKRDTAKSRALMADVLYGVGAVGVGVGAWLIFTGPSASESPPSVSLGLAPTSSGALVVLAGGF
jgi:TolB-like protein